MPNLELDLLDNAVDSLNEALKKYQQGKEGDQKAYKFCIQHLSHFFELILKYYVTQSHPLLIYKNPFAKIINGESQTIGLHEAVNFLKNEGHDFSKDFEDDLKWLKKLRNDIEHHKFSMNVTEVDDSIGRLMKAIVIFDEEHENIDLSGHISNEHYEVFHTLAETYEGRLIKAKKEVEDAEKEAYRGVGPKEYGFVKFAIYHCYECDHETMIPNEDSSTGYKCTFCGNEESDEIEEECTMCGSAWPRSEMSCMEWTDEGDYENLCPVCMRHPEYVRDD
jgi:hypothetical protein